MQIVDYQDDILVVSAIYLGFAGLAILITWLFTKPSCRSYFQQYEGLNAAFLGLPALVFSMTTALVATTVWDNYSISNKAIKEESQGILNIMSLANSFPLLKDTQLSVSALAYTQSVIDDEWQTLATNRSASSRTNERFITMRQKIFEAASLLGRKVESDALLKAFDSVNNARETRIAYASLDLHPVRWYAILFSGFLVMLTVAFIHTSNHNALKLAMVISTLTISNILSMIALTFSSPYQGLISISHTPYLQILK
jgi:hypothetical protein